MLIIARLLNGIAFVAAVLALVGAVDPVFAACPTAVGCGVHGAPGPIAGAGLPIVAVAIAAYWLVRRYRQKSQ